MNIKIVFIALCIAINSYANDDLRATEAAINDLTIKIVQQDKVVAGMVKRLQHFINSFKNDKRSMMSRDVADDDLNMIYLEEVKKYVTKFCTEKDKPSELIFDDNFFGKNSSLLKFYIISLQQQSDVLDALMKEWALLQDSLKDLIVRLGL